MKSFKDWYKEISGKDFDINTCQQSLAAVGIPMVVTCTCCKSILLLPSAYLDDENYIYCSSCAGVEE